MCEEQVTFSPITPPRWTNRDQNNQVVICFLSPLLSPWSMTALSGLFVARSIAVNAASGGKTWPSTELCWWGEPEGTERLPSPGGATGRLLLILHTMQVRPQSSTKLSLIRKKDSLSAPSPTQRSISAQATLNWYIFPHYSVRPLLCVPAARQPSARDWEALRLRAVPLLSSPWFD